MTKVGQADDFQAIREKIQSVNHKCKSELEKWRQFQKNHIQSVDIP